MGVFEAMRAAGYAVAVCRQAFVDSGRPRDQHRDYDAALRRAEDALVDMEAGVDVLEPEQLFECTHPGCGCHTDDRYAPIPEEALAPAFYGPSCNHLGELIFGDGPCAICAEADAGRLEPAERCGICNRQLPLVWGVCGDCFDADLEDEAYDINADFDARREARTETWLRDTDSPVEGSGDATGGVNSPPSVVPLSELVDQVADELRAQHQPHWLADKVRATALMLKTQGL